MSTLDKIRLFFHGLEAVKALRAPGFQWHISLLKGLRVGLGALCVFGLPPLFLWLSDESHALAFLAASGVPEAVAVVLSAVVAGLSKLALNAWKNYWGDPSDPLSRSREKTPQTFTHKAGPGALFLLLVALPAAAQTPEERPITESLIRLQQGGAGIARSNTPYFGSPEEPLTYPRAIVWAAVPKAFDLYSTAVCLRENPTCVEANPNVPDVEHRVSAAAAVVPVAAAAFYHLENSEACRNVEGETRLGCKVPRYLWALLHTAVGINNLRTAGRF